MVTGKPKDALLSETLLTQRAGREAKRGQRQGRPLKGQGEKGVGRREKGEVKGTLKECRSNGARKSRMQGGKITMDGRCALAKGS